MHTFKHDVYASLAVVGGLCAGVTHAADPECPSYYSESTVPLIATIPLVSPPPGGHEFFTLDRPTLRLSKDGYEERADFVSYDQPSSSLTLVFCDVTADELRPEAILRLGPREVGVQVALRRGGGPREKRPWVTARGSRPVAIDWIAPLGSSSLDVLPTQWGRKVNIRLGVPSLTRTKLTSLKLRFMHQRAVCRGLYGGPDTVNEPIPVHVDLSTSKGRERAIAGLFYPGEECGPSDILDVDLGGFRTVVGPVAHELSFQLTSLRFDQAAPDHCSTDPTACRLFGFEAVEVSIQTDGQGIHPSKFILYQRE